jgi:hypothetical protein
LIVRDEIPDMLKSLKLYYSMFNMSTMNSLKIGFFESRRERDILKEKGRN